MSEEEERDGKTNPGKSGEAGGEPAAPEPKVDWAGPGPPIMSEKRARRLVQKKRGRPSSSTLEAQGKKLCTARRVGTEERCRNSPVRGRSVCRFHGGLGGSHSIDELNARLAPIRKETMKNNVFAVTNGLFAKKLLGEDEFAAYEIFKTTLREEYPELDYGADEVVLHMMGLEFAKLHTAYRFSHTDGIGAMTARLHKGLTALNIRRDRREAPKVGDLASSPAQLAVELAKALAGRNPGSVDVRMQVVATAREKAALMDGKERAAAVLGEGARTIDVDGE